MNNSEYILPDEIKSILSRYYDGLTSLEEERILKKYFSEHQVPDEYLTDKSVLNYCKADESFILPENKLWNKIKENEWKQRKNRRVVTAISSIAASLVILISIGTWYYTSEKGNGLVHDTYSNPEDAYKAVQKYLGFVSNKLTYAYTEIKPIEKLAIPAEAMQPFNEINRNFERLNQINKINTTKSKLERFSIFSEIVKVNKN